jgi:hypothetical protein
VRLQDKEKNMDFNQALKLLADQYYVNAGNKSFMLMALRTGENVTAYAMPPVLMKSLRDALTSIIDVYEKQNGEIDMTGADFGIQSPVESL